MEPTDAPAVPAPASRRIEFEICGDADDCRVWTTGALACDGYSFHGTRAECEAWIARYHAEHDAPANRSGEDHAAFVEQFCATEDIYLRPGTAGRLAVAIERRFTELLSRDSGEAVKRAREWLDQNRLGMVVLGRLGKANEMAADVLALSASAARLTEERDQWRERAMEDNKRLREALERYGRHEHACLGGVCTCGLDAVLSPTASSPEEQQWHKIVAGGPPCPTCGFRIRIEECKPFVFDDDEGGKAPAGGAEEKR